MFKFSFHAGNSQDVADINLADVFDDIVVTDNLDRARANGFIVLAYKEFRPKTVAYMVKPTAEVIEHMERTGRGTPTGAEVMPTGWIGFTATWEGAGGGFTTTPAIAGRIKPSTIEKYKAQATVYE